MAGSQDGLARRAAGRTGWRPSALVRLVGWIIGLILVVLFAAPISIRGAEMDEARRKLIAGEYDACIAAAAEAIAADSQDECWPVLKAQAELLTGRADDARRTVDAGLKRHGTSVRLRLLGHRACSVLGEPDRARELLEEIPQLARRAPWRYTDAEDLMALGEAALMSGADPREVLDDFVERAKRQDPECRAPWLAGGQLALGRHDFERAADTFREALTQFPDDADIHFGLARALFSTDADRAEELLSRALELNPRHVPALLFRADRCIDAERFAAAERLLGRVLEVNPHEPDALAFRAVIAHLNNDPAGEQTCREAALGRWKKNPTVDHLIGLKLSQKYRFRAGAAYQRRALAIDPDFQPARVQLCQDLLCLGKEAEGWAMADEAHRRDRRNPVASNLLELRDRLSQFRTLEDEHFVVRMDAHEAAVYGDRVLALLHRAKDTLCAKYGLELNERITVEIFPDEADFAVRTFGLPGASGYLGVCFGRVITAGSPAAHPDHPINWEAILWHEFCHVVTLELTHNTMPRWLSEGISVYEEWQADPTWGQRMNPQYRQMILGGELTPVGRMSGAFAQADAPLPTQFAYFQSALLVEFVVERYGLDALQAVLHDLGAGLPVNAALERHTDELARLDEEFQAFARRKAEALAPDADWDRAHLPALLGSDDDTALERWIAEHPRNVAALGAWAERLMDAGRHEDAKEPLQRLIALCPGDVGPEGPFAMLAEVHRQLGDHAAERAVLQRIAAVDGTAFPVLMRLVELQAAAEDWPAVMDATERLLAINPLIAPPYQARARAAEELGRAEEAIAAWRTLLELKPADPAAAHYRLARLLHEQGDLAAAAQHVLLALETAPRFRTAQRLLRDIGGRE